MRYCDVFKAKKPHNPKRAELSPAVRQLLERLQPLQNNM